MNNSYGLMQPMVSKYLFNIESGRLILAYRRMKMVTAVISTALKRSYDNECK